MSFTYAPGSFGWCGVEATAEPGAIGARVGGITETTSVEFGDGGLLFDFIAEIFDAVEFEAAGDWQDVVAALKDSEPAFTAFGGPHSGPLRRAIKNDEAPNLHVGAISTA